MGRGNNPLPYTKMFSFVTQLGIPYDEVMSMSYSRLVMFIQAQQEEKKAGDTEEARMATQEDIRNWM